MGGGGHNNFHRGILKVPVKLFSGEFSSWIVGISVLCLGTLVDLAPFFWIGPLVGGSFLTFFLKKTLGFRLGLECGIDKSVRG